MAAFKKNNPAKPAPHVLERNEFEGRFRHVTFENEDGSFRVVIFVTVDGEEFKAAGNLVGAAPGELMRLRGEWKEHPRHGWTFSIASWQPILPETEDAILAYLGSGLIKGMRESTARKIVDYFGDKTLLVLDETPELLLNVPKLTRATAMKIIEQWEDHRNAREAMMFFKQHGLSNAIAARLLRHYGDNAVAVLRTNPYRAGLEVQFIGFMKADQIAGQLGIGRDAPERLHAAFVHVLDQASAEGHTHLPRAALVEKATTLLGVEQVRVDEALDEAVKLAYIRRCALPETPEAYFMPSLHKCETGVARRLLELLRDARPLLRGDVDARLSEFEARFKFNLAPQQRDAIRSIAHGGVCVVTGGPGTGKTTLVRALLHLVRAAQVKFALASPTGRAAQRLAETTNGEASTIHRLLKWNGQSGAFMHQEDNPLPYELLIIDEASMLDIPLAFQLLRAVQNGATVVFVGDVDQLPSVGPGSFLRDLIVSGRARVTRLQTIFRQAEQSLIIRNAHRINTGERLQLPREGDAASDFYFIDRPTPEAIAEALLRMVTERIPRRLNVDPIDGLQVLTPMRRGTLGTIELNQMLQQALNPTGPAVGGMQRQFRIGDKVIQNQNNYDLDVYNGDIGRIEGIHPETRQIRVRFGRRAVLYPLENLDELELAYAITIHKSQGSEYPASVVLLHTSHFIMLRRNLLYTAVTRGKNLVVVIGSPRAVYRAIRSAGENERLSALAYWLTRPPEKEDLLG